MLRLTGRCIRSRPVWDRPPSPRISRGYAGSGRNWRLKPVQHASNPTQHATDDLQCALGHAADGTNQIAEPGKQVDIAIGLNARLLLAGLFLGAAKRLDLFGSWGDGVILLRTARI